MADKEGEEGWGGHGRDYRDYVNFPSGGLVLTAGRDADGRFPDDPYFDPQTLNGDLTAAGELPSSAYRHMGEGGVWAAHELECAAARDRRTAAGFPRATRSWDTAKPVAALEASSAAYSAMAAACRRSSRLPVLYTLCAMRALVAAKRGELEPARAKARAHAKAQREAAKVRKEAASAAEKQGSAE